MMHEGNSRKLARHVVVGIAALSLLGGAAQAQIEWSPIQEVTRGNVSENVAAKRPRLASDGGGNLVALYETVPSATAETEPVPAELGIRMTRSTDNGITWTAPSAVANAGTGERPDIASDKAGNWVAAWQSGEAPGTVITARLSTNNGTSWLNAGTISSVFGTQINSSANVALAVNASGLWVSAWSATQASDTTAVVALASLNAAGTAWQGITRIPGVMEGTSPAIAAHPTQGFVVVYEVPSGEESADSTDIGFAKLAANGTVTTRSLVAGGTEVHDYGPSVSVNPQGQWVVTWSQRSPSDASQWVLVASTSSDGINWTDPAPLTPMAAAQFMSEDQADSSVAAGADGRFAALWTSGETGTSFARDVYYSFQRSIAEPEVDFSRVDLDFSEAETPYFLRPHLVAAGGNRWVGMFQRLETVPDDSALSASLPWTIHGLESGEVAQDEANTVDLEITKTAYPNPVPVNGNLGYVITVRNLSTSFTANLVRVRDALPSTVQFRHAVASQGEWAYSTLANQNVLVASLGSIAPGASATVAIGVRVTGSSGSISNTATVSFLGTDTNNGNNSSTANASIGNPVNPDPDPEPNPDPEPEPEPEVPEMLRITTDKLKVNGKEPKPGKKAKPYKVKLRVTAENTDVVASAATAVNLYLSDDDVFEEGVDALIAQKALKSIKPGKSKKNNLNAKVAGNPTGKFLFVVVADQTPVPVPILP